MQGGDLPLPQLPAEKRGAGYAHEPQGTGEPAQPGGQEAAAIDLAGRLAHQRRRHFARFLGIGAEQRTVAGHIDHARNARRQPVHLAQRRGREYFLGGAGDPQPVAHIALSFLARQGLQVISAGDSLRQLAQIGAVQQFAKFRLPDQNDLQQLLRGGLQIGQQPDLLQHLGGQVLRLVHDHDDAPPFGVGRQQPPIERIHHLLDAVAIARRQCGRPSSSQMVSRNSTGVTRGFNITATSA